MLLYVVIAAALLSPNVSNAKPVAACAVVCSLAEVQQAPAATAAGRRSPRPAFFGFSATAVPHSGAIAWFQLRQ